ncbi:MAG TPA: PEGA domain-containing protein, partial [Pseudomonadota bacterium]|nr:PEGA domain-containing protein [Pseudomonadota bacterium]
AGQLPASPPRRFPLSIAIGGLVGGVGVGLLLIFSLNKSPPPPVLPPPPRPVVQRAPPEPVKQLVQCSLSTTPTGAQVIRQRDGEVLGTTPLTLKYAQGSSAEQVRVVLAGYVEMPLTLAFDKDSEQELELQRKAGRDKHAKDSGAKSKKAGGKGYVPSDLTVVD